MADPREFCRMVMHEYERQWSRATGHGVRHPLRLKIERLQGWCGLAQTDEAFEAQLQEGLASDDPGTALLAEEMLSLWHASREGKSLPFAHPD